jgi:hypothetical protein
MGIIKRISLILFGLLSGLIGFIAIFTSVTFIIGSFFFGSFDDMDNIGGRLMITLWASFICELFLAFGITASLLGLRCVLSPKDWITRISNYFWSKAVMLALVLPFIIWIFLAIGLLVNYLFF